MVMPEAFRPRVKAAVVVDTKPLPRAKGTLSKEEQRSAAPAKALDADTRAHQDLEFRAFLDWKASKDGRAPVKESVPAKTLEAKTVPAKAQEAKAVPVRAQEAPTQDRPNARSPSSAGAKSSKSPLSVSLSSEAVGGVDVKTNSGRSRRLQRPSSPLQEERLPSAEVAALQKQLLELSKAVQKLSQS